MTSAVAVVRPQPTIRFRGRSFMAFVLAPVLPVANWLVELDKWSRTSPDFFAGRPIILDLSAVPLDTDALARLVASLAERGIRVMGIEGARSDALGPSLPPLIRGGRPAGSEPQADGGASPARSEPTSLLIEHPIRSGQSVTYPYGDIIVLGAISSGAEVVAGGSIHVYGALRGRAMAGSMGNAKARIFCSRNEAELIAIDGYYRTAEEMDADLYGRPTQCWLADQVLVMRALD